MATRSQRLETLRDKLWQAVPQNPFALIALQRIDEHEEVRVMKTEIDKHVIIQCHWLNPATGETIWLSQTDGIETFEQLREWIDRSRHNAYTPCPEGWDVLVCTQESKHFAYGPKQEEAAE